MTPSAEERWEDAVGAEHAAGEQTSSAGRLGWLRAAVLGADDGIVSVAAVVVGVAGASSARGAIFTAGLAAWVGGAVSMALGEYVSVSSQRDSERAQLGQERRELRDDPDRELEEITAIYRGKGLRPETALTVARELTRHDALAAHADAELGLDPAALASPWPAALASAASFSLGAAVPLLAVLLPPSHLRIVTTVLAVVGALAASGAFGAVLGRSPLVRPVLRVVLGGGLALAATFLVGRAFGTAVS